MSNKKCCCCSNEMSMKRTLRSDTKSDNWTLRNNSTQINAVLTPDIYEESCDSDENYAPKNEVTKTRTKIKWASPYNKHTSSKYHQKCISRKAKKFPKTKLKKQIIPSQLCRNSSPNDKTPKFINECYCCSAPNKPLLPKIPDLIDPGSRSDNYESPRPCGSDSSYSLETLRKAKDLIDYSPESKFLKRLRKEANEVYDCKCHECKVNNENANFKFTERRKFLEDAYKEVEDYKRFDFDSLCRDLHQCGYKNKCDKTSPRKTSPKTLSPSRTPSPRLRPRKYILKQPEHTNSPLYPPRPSNKPTTHHSKFDIHSCRPQSPFSKKETIESSKFQSTRRNSPSEERSYPERSSKSDYFDCQPSTTFKRTGNKDCNCHLISNLPTHEEVPNYNRYQPCIDKKSISNQSSNYQNSASSKHNAQNCEKIHSIQNIRSDNYFECHSTAHLTPTPIPNHQCVHKFALDDRLLPKPENADAFGVSRCTICNKPMENSSKIENYARNQQSTCRPCSGTTLKYSYTAPRKINIGGKNDVIELKVPPNLLEDDKINRFKKRIVPEDTWALRYQKGVV